jgi:hypothetical protein
MWVRLRSAHFLWLLLFLLLGPHPAAAQIADSIPPLVVQLPASVRSIAMNGAGVALVGDAGAVFSNPAGIATLSHVGLEASYRSAPGGAYLTTGALGWRVAQFDLGIAGRYFDLGSDPAQYLGPAVTAGSNVREALVIGSLVYRFGLLAIGVNGKYARRSADSVHVRGLTGDAGIAIAFFDIMALAFAVQNIGGNWRDDSGLTLPRRTRLGFTTNYVDPQETFRLLSTVEIEWHEGAGARLLLGGEAGIVVSGVGIIGRLGYGGRPVSVAGSRLTLGGTVTFAALSLDYAFRADELLGQSAHYFGARLTL